MGKTLILIGLVLVAVGLLWMGAERLGLLGSLGRLPGDIAIERGNVRFYFSIVTCLRIKRSLCTAKA